MYGCRDGTASLRRAVGTGAGLRHRSSCAPPGKSPLPAGEELENGYGRPVLAHFRAQRPLRRWCTRRVGEWRPLRPGVPKVDAYSCRFHVLAGTESFGRRSCVLSASRTTHRHVFGLGLILAPGWLRPLTGAQDEKTCRSPLLVGVAFQRRPLGDPASVVGRKRQLRLSSLR